MIDWPIISSAVNPKIRAAAGFQLVTILFRSLETIASSAFCTMAARYCSASDGSRGFDIEARTDFELAYRVDASSNCETSRRLSPTDPKHASELFGRMLSTVTRLDPFAQPIDTDLYTRVRLDVVTNTPAI